MTTLLPAFGRSYNKASDAQRDWHNGKDFLESFSRRAANIQDIPGSVVLRYGKQLEKVTAYDAAIKRKLDKVIAAEKASIPPQVATFQEWMISVDKATIAASGMSYQDLPDIDFYSSFEAGVPVAMVVSELLTEAGFN